MQLLVVAILVALAILLFVRARRPARPGSAAGGRPDRRNLGDARTVLRRVGIALAVVFLLVILVQDDEDDEPTIEREPCPAYDEEDCPPLVDTVTTSTLFDVSGDEDEEIPREPCPAYHEEDCPPVIGAG